MFQQNFHSKKPSLYTDKINGAGQALLHLLLHCCHKDGELHHKELLDVARMLQQAGHEAPLQLDAELESYRQYANHIKDETAYLSYLIRLINPKHRLVLLWYCAQLAATDRNISFSEEVLIYKIGAAMYIKPTESLLLQQLAVQIRDLQPEQA